jgi:hypothetical protein
MARREACGRAVSPGRIWQVRFSPPWLHKGLKFSLGQPIRAVFPSEHETLMSKTIAKNNHFILSLLRDAYGNGLTGNTERSLRYIREALKLAEAQQAVIETKGDARKQMAFDRLNRQTVEQEGWPAFDGSNVQENVQRWAERGLTLDALPAIPADQAEA